MSLEKPEMIDKEFYCEKHGIKYTSKVLNIFGSSVFACCPECAKEQKGEEEFTQDKQNEMLKRDGYIKQRIRPEFFNATFENYIALNETHKAAVDACKSLINGEIKKLILIGSNGLGKSHLGNATLKIMGGERYTAYELSCMYRQCYSAKPMFDEMGLVDRLVHLPFLLIEELGKTKGSEAELNFLSYLFDELHTHRTPFMINTNKIKKVDCPLFQKSKESCRNCMQKRCIESFIENDTVSRLSQNGKIVVMTGDDYRRK